MSSRHVSHAYAVVTLIPMAWFVFGGCAGATAESEADARPACTTEVISEGFPNSGTGGPESGTENEKPGFVHVTNATECGLSARLALPENPSQADDDALTIECKALCCGATSCAGTMVGCSMVAADEVKCDAYGY